MTKGKKREILKATPLGAATLGEVVPGDSAELADGTLVQVAWQSDDVTAVRVYDAAAGPHTRSPSQMPAATRIVAVLRKDRAAVANGVGFDPVRGGGA